MEQFLKDKFKKGTNLKDMDMDYKYGQMALNMKVIGEITWHQEEECSIMSMGISMMVII